MIIYPPYRAVFDAVRDFHAIVDGVTDTTPQVQACWNAAAAVRGIAYHPTGIYLTNGNLIPSGFMTIMGAGRQQTIFRLANGKNVDVIGLPAANISYLTLRDFTIDGNKANNLTGGSGIHLASNQGQLINVEVTSCRQRGIHFDNIGAATGGNVLSAPRVTLCELAGILVGSSDLYLSEGDIGYNSTSATYEGGIYVTAGTCHVMNSEIYNNSTGVVIAGGVPDCWFEGNSFDINGRCAIWIRPGGAPGTRRNLVQGNLFRGNSNETSGLYPAIGLGQVWGGDGAGAIGPLSVKDNLFFGGGAGGDANIPAQHKWCIESEGGQTLTDIDVKNNIFQGGFGTAAIAGLAGTRITIRFNDGYATENNGASTGTGAQQAIAHGLAFTPTRQQIALIAGSATANPFHSAAPDATNIYVTAANTQPWYWGTVG